MPTLAIREFTGAFVIHFTGEATRINAYTLASTLVGIADAARAANAVLNPGYEIEVVVDALTPGSFRATIRAVYRKAGNLFSARTLRELTIGVIAAFIYEHTLAPSHQITVNVTATEVIVVHGSERIIVPRDIYEATKEVTKSPRFRKGVADAARAVAADNTVRSFALTPEGSSAPPIPIPRERLELIPEFLAPPEGEERVLEVVTDLRIIRAILERTQRRWEFIWNGIRISAPIVDDRFYDDFFAHRITVAPGDLLRVRLRVFQRVDPRHGMFLNTGYEVTEVISHSAGQQQTDLRALDDPEQDGA